MIKAFIHNRSLKNSLILAKGYVSGQVILLLSSPILTRIYTVEEFGVFAIFSSLLGILGVISGCRYELAIVIASNTTRANAVSIVNIWCICISASLVGLCLFIYKDADITLIKEIKEYIWMLVVSVVIFCVYENFGYWGVRLKRFSSISNGAIIYSSITTAIQVVLGTFGAGPAGLILGIAIGKLFSSVYLYRKFYSVFCADRRTARIEYLCKVANRYRRFPAYSMWQALANSASSLLPAILFANYFSTLMAGLFLIAQRFTSIPVSLIGRSLGQVYFSEAIEARKSNIDVLTIKYVQWLAVTLSIPFVLMGIYSPTLFEVIFGSEWRQAGVYVTWMVPWLFVQCLVSPISNIASVMEEQFIGLCSQLLLLVFRIAPIILALKFGYEEPIIWFSIGSYFGYLQRLCVSLYIARVNRIRILVFGIIVVMAGYFYLLVVVW